MHHLRSIQNAPPNEEDGVRGRGQVSRIKIDLRMTLKEIGDAAGGVDYKAVSDRVRRYERAGVVSEMEKQIYSILNLET
jgi:hypothetical protein